jgi:hypothetical protein
LLFGHFAEFGQALNTKVVDLFNTFPESIYSLILVEYSGSYDYWNSLSDFVSSSIQLTRSVWAAD